MALEEFNEALEDLKQVHSQRDLEKARQRVFKARDQLLATSEKFRKEHEERQQETAARIEMTRHSVNSAMRKATKSKAEGLSREFDPWMKNPYLRKINRELSKTDSAMSLVCSRCGDVDHGNRNGKKHWCFKCNVELVPKALVKNYGRIKLAGKITDEAKKKGWY